VRQVRSSANAESRTRNSFAPGEMRGSFRNRAGVRAKYSRGVPGVNGSDDTRGDTSGGEADASAKFVIGGTGEWAQRF